MATRPCEAARTWRTTTAHQTHALGERLGRLAQAGDLLLLSGPLGAGKTALTQGLAAGLGIAEAVNSPTFTLLKEHPTGRIPLYHFDLYRIEHAAELEDLGFGEYFDGAGIAVVEWADRVPEDLWGEDLLWLQFEILAARSRRIAVCAQGARSVAWLAAIEE